MEERVGSFCRWLGSPGMRKSWEYPDVRLYLLQKSAGEARLLAAAGGSLADAAGPLPFLDLLNGRSVRIEIEQPVKYGWLQPALSLQPGERCWVLPVHFDDLFFCVCVPGELAGDVIKISEAVLKLQVSFLSEYSGGAGERRQLPEGSLSFLGGSREIGLVWDFVNQLYQFGWRGPVLIQGEAGVGKSRLVDFMSGLFFAGEPFFRVDCISLKEGYLEQEVFGWGRGRMRATKGRLQQVGQGLVYLSEIGHAHLGFQERLLAALKDGFFRDALGEAAPLRASLVFSSSYNLEAMVEAGRFLPELYRVLAASSVLIPSLRRRPDDIEFLARAIVRRLNRENNIEVGCDEPFLKSLARMPLAGNMAELEARLEFAYYRSINDLIRYEDVEAAGTWPDDFKGTVRRDYDLRSAVADLEKDMLLKAYVKCGGNQVQIAKLLGISRGSLQYRMQKLGIKEK